METVFIAFHYRYKLLEIVAIALHLNAIHDIVGGATTGDAPTTSEWRTSEVRLILEVWRYFTYIIIHSKFASSCY